MMLWLKHAGIVPQKHILDNEVSTEMKTIIRNEYKMEIELVPPVCHCRNSAEATIRNQGSLPQCIGGHSRGLPTIFMGPTATTNQGYSQSPSTFQFSTQRVRLHPSQRNIPL